MEAGTYRMYLESVDDDDWVIVYAPLAEDGSFGTGPQPYLVKALWEGYVAYGELKRTGDEHNAIEWAGEAVDSATELLTAPVKLGSIVRIYEGDTVGGNDAYDFRVRDLRKL
jgi:hypothetical protein